MGNCAYCGSDEKSTREHIIPAFLYRELIKMGGHEGWNESAGKILKFEAKINDTCANCNNRLLGNLDAHASQVLKNSGVFITNFLSEFATLEFDYGLLERWLLKVSFNSARATNNSPAIFNQHVPYILGKQQRSRDIFVLSGIQKPAKLTEEEMIKYQGKLPFDSNGLSNPFFVRITRFSQFEDGFVASAVIVGALLFLIILFSSQEPIGYKRSKVKQLMKMYPGMQTINPTSRFIRLGHMTLTFLDTQEDQAIRLQNLGLLKNC